MFNESFYPTPADIATKMYRELEYKSRRTILEPSAGKGDILKALKYSIDKFKVYCIEQHPDLQAILREQGYPVVASDFMTWDGELHFDTVLMNPPFADGDKHLLRAWDLLPSGEIVCLLNAETINNPFSATRKLLLNIIAEHGKVTMLGSVFKTAERTTRANIAMVYLKKDATGDKDPFGSMDFNKSKDTFKDDEFLNAPPAVRRGFIKEAVESYQLTRDAFKDWLKATRRLKQACMFTDGKALAEKALMQPSRWVSSEKEDYNEVYNDFIALLKQSAWKHVLDRPAIVNILPSSMAAKFSAFLEGQSAMAYDEENISQVLTMLLDNRENMMSDAIIEVFNLLTAYDAKNKVFPKGWKTNSPYKVNMKVIVPTFIKFDNRIFHAFETRYEAHGKMDDIDRALCFLSGKRMEDILTIRDAFYLRFHPNSRDKKKELYDAINRPDNFENEVESEFFKIKYFKVGTTHLVFKDEWVWAKLNQFA